MHQDAQLLIKINSVLLEIVNSILIMAHIAHSVNKMMKQFQTRSRNVFYFHKSLLNDLSDPVVSFYSVMYQSAQVFTIPPGKFLNTVKSPLATFWSNLIRGLASLGSFILINFTLFHYFQVLTH